MQVLTLGAMHKQLTYISNRLREDAINLEAQIQSESLEGVTKANVEGVICGLKMAVQLFEDDCHRLESTAKCLPKITAGLHVIDDFNDLPALEFTKQEGDVQGRTNAAVARREGAAK